MSDGKEHVDERPAEVVPVLDYRTPRAEGLVTVETFVSAVAARMAAGQLGAQGIPYAVMDELTNSLGIPYSGFSNVKLQVRQCDLERARAVLAGAGDEGTEQEIEADGSAVVTGADGAKQRYVPVGAYGSVGAIKDAALRLGVARIDALLPKEARKVLAEGADEDGTERQLVLRVLEGDVERARAVLEQEVEADEEDGPQCPACGSWRVAAVSVPAPLAHRVLAAVGLAPALPEEWECLRCKRRWGK